MTTDRMRRVAVLGAIVLVVVAGGALAAPDYTVSIPGSIDTPDRNVSVEGDSYTISSIARVEKGQTLRVETSGPDGESYRVYVHGVDNGTQTVQDTKFVGAEADGTVTFDTSEFSPGSYTVSIYDSDSGDYHSPHPVVVPAFEVSVDAPASPTVDESFDVTVSTERVESGPSIRNVELVFSNGDDTKRVAATASNGDYEASVTLSKTGDWDVYAAVSSNEEALRGEYELVGISDPVSVAVESQQTTTTTTTSTTTTTTTSSTGGTGGTGGGGGGADTTTTTTTSSTTSTTATTTEVSTTTRTSTTATKSTDSTTSTTVSATTTTSVASTSSSSVIEPNESSSTTPSSGSSNGVVGTVPLALLALLSAVALLIR
jgi:hypothetical protein